MWAVQHFREYHFGQPFTVVTDHKLLRWLMLTNKTTSKLAGLSLLLQEYDITVQHKKGALITNADCLSRFPLLSPPNEQPLLDWDKGEYNIARERVFTTLVGQDQSPP